MTTKPLLPVGRTFIQKAANLGTWRAAILGPTTGLTVADTLRVALWDASGRTAVWNLPAVSNNSQEACCCLVQDRLIVACRPQAAAPNFSKTVVTEFRTPADPFTGASTFVSQLIYGDSDSRSADFARLRTGEVVSMTAQHSSMTVCAAVRGVNGQWVDQGTFQLSTEIGNAHFFSCCAAPWADNEVWAFMVLDGGKGIAAGVFNYVNGKLQLTRTIPTILKTGLPTSDYGVNGELPALVATTDSTRNQILLTYTNNQWIDGHDQQAFPVVVGINSAGIPTGIARGSEVIVSIKNHVPVVATASAIEMDYRTGNPAVTIVGPGFSIPTRDGQFGWNQYAQELVYTQPDMKDANGNLIPGPVVLSILLPSPTPIPPAHPNLQISPMAYVSWSGADPTNAGTYMLQKGPSPTGPWTDFADHYPVAFQAPGVKQQNAPIGEANGEFYRLRLKA